MRITILTDDKKSWFIPFGNKLRDKLENLGHTVSYIDDVFNLDDGDVCFLLSCSRIVKEQYLLKNKNNIVVHASDLPEGKGFSPLQWQILEGKEEIVLTLFEVVADVDAGPYYIKDKIRYNGTELYDELRSVLGEKIIEMCIYFIENINDLKPVEQTGTETFYKRRTNDDDKLDPAKTIEEQFNHFRIADNRNHPLFFELRGKKYYLNIYSEEYSKKRND